METAEYEFALYIFTNNALKKPKDPVMNLVPVSLP